MEPPFPPFEPDDDQNTRLRDIPFKTLVPNIITLLAICAGLTAIRFAIEGRLEHSIAAIIVAAFLDGIDGRVARYLQATSRFGEQMDSLADFVNFGVTPPLILYFLFLQDAKPLGWIVALIFTMCACLRLARFNVQLDIENRPSWKNNYFVGVPAPAGALIVLLPVYFHLLGVEKSDILNWFSVFYVIFCGFLLVSNIPTFSGKNIGEHIPRDIALPLILALVILVAVLFSFPWETLIAASLGYLAMIPLSMKKYHEKLATQKPKSAKRKRQQSAKPKSKE